MKVFFSSLQAKNKLKAATLVLGNFDGVHLAHQAMFSLANTEARASRSLVWVYTFHPHPAVLLTPQAAPRMLMTLEQKIRTLKTMKLGGLIVEKFDKKFAGQSAIEWFEKIILGRIKPKVIVAGYDFTFGHARSGNVELLKALCAQHHIHCSILKPFYLQDTLVSSSRIRQLLTAGEVKIAAKLLGRPYFLEGKIVKGAGRGRKLGIPTANLATINELIPQAGVYATQMEVAGKKYPAITNIGFNPTFGDNHLTVETYLFDFNRLLYQKNVQLHFMARIRAERKFPTPALLVKQIKKDFAQARKIHARKMR